MMELTDLLAEVKRLRMDIEWHRVQHVQLQAEVDRERQKVGDLVRKLNDLTRGQGEVWPAGASLPAGPPLPRRTPGESLKPCGWMGIEPMTDPALEDRTEGEQP